MNRRPRAIDGYPQSLDPDHFLLVVMDGVLNRSPSSRHKTFSIISSAFIVSFFPNAFGRLRHLLELFECGVQARLHGSDRYLQNIGDFTVLEVLVIGQDQRLARASGNFANAVSHPLLAFRFLKFRQQALHFH